ncbi:hypothetical protein HPB48_026033 [Haemaphysalis longicornis]|uniref:Cuticle protein n=1 Tax=Haemaphysalis longicornis TaxID=44386 RepID=A0A9J6H8K6_HAELO|nr:hypothetical protein HPB48_026033 [Haemaphysalis longicornis]
MPVERSIPKAHMGPRAASTMDTRDLWSQRRPPQEALLLIPFTLLFCSTTYPSLFYKFTQPPQPYSFGYDNTDEFGTQTYHKEQGDASNTKTGSYGYRDEYGIFRRVNYVADANGFRATIDTNEPGTAAGRSADAVFNANPVAAPVRAKSASAPFPTYVAAPVYGSGYTAPGGVAPWAG